MHRLIMLAACLLLSCAIIGGTLITFLFDAGATRAARICLGACLGLPLLASIGYVFSLWLGLSATSIVLSAITLLLPFLLLLNASHRERILNQFAGSRRKSARSSTGNLAYIFFYVAVAILLGLVFNRVVVEHPEGIYSGVTNNLGDLPLHMQVIHSFVQGHNIPPEDPTYAGARFAYPFLVDFLAAMLMRAGAGIVGAMWLQNMLMGLALVGSLQYFTLQLTRSRHAGFIAPLLVIFSGGLGWWLLFSEPTADGFFSLLGNLPHDYTILNVPNSLLRWGNSLTTLFVPQRSILFGLPLAIFVFCQWWIAVAQKTHASNPAGAPADPAKASAATQQKPRSLSKKAKAALAATAIAETPSSSRNRMLVAGIAAGLLPLVHAHTFLVTMAVAACLMLIFHSAWRHWLVFFAAAILVSFPQIMWLAHTGVNASSFLGWHFGWDHSIYNVVWYWFVNTGLFIPILVLALVWQRGDLALPQRLVRFYTPFIFCFIIPNLVRLAPWDWDNIKVLFLWYVASAPLVALFLARLWAQKTLWRWLVPPVLASMFFAGSLDVLRVISEATENREFDPQGIALAHDISTQTGPRALVLHATTFNTPVFLTGRRTLLGFPAWTWSRGLDFAQRSVDIQRIYAGGPDAVPLMQRYGIDYVLIGPDELASLYVNQPFWSQYPVQAQEGPYRLYKIH